MRDRLFMLSVDIMQAFLSFEIGVPLMGAADIGIFGHQFVEIRLGYPDKGQFGSKKHVDFLEGPLAGFRVESPH